MKMIRNLRVAISFMTRIPVRHKHEPNIGAAAPWFPVVGVIVGTITGTTAWAISQFCTPLVGAAVGVCVGLLVTGAFHEDGLADVADAFVGGWTNEERLRILKDPLHGTYGVAAISGSIAIRIIALGSISPKHMIAYSIAAHCIARASALFLMLNSAPATQTGLGADYVQRLPRMNAIISIALSIGFCFLITQSKMIVCFLLVTLFTFIVRQWSKRKIGGITGDVLGTVEQVSEIAALVALSAK